MILWCDGSHDARENMRRDSALLARVSEAPGEPVLRLFGFDPEGITLGYSQRPEHELDLERCRRDGVAWAVRPTGGRAIFHAEEWTYSLSSSNADPDWGGDRATAYARVSRAVLESLRALGVPAELAPGSRARRGSNGWAGASAPCFASTARHEIVLAGRKLVGSAQRRTATGLLQQGSVLLGDGHLRLADYLAPESGAREPLRARLSAVATHAGHYLGARPALDRWARALLSVLPRGTRRVDGALGLTLTNDASYTPPMPCTASPSFGEG
jgi:lipoate-protein ligase A